VGFLVERSQTTLSGIRHLTEYLEATFSVFRIQNNENAVLLGLARRSYDSAAVGLTWHPAEEWRVGVQLTGTRTQLPGLTSETTSDWRTSMALIWSPRRSTTSW
jgi:hypothetical protein